MIPHPNPVGLSVVLKADFEVSESIPLTAWLAETDCTPIWIPLRRSRGLTKVLAIVLNSQQYAKLLQRICQQLMIKPIVEWQGKAYRVDGIETLSGELFALQIAFNPQKKLPPTIGRALHALFLQWIAKANPALASDIHDRESSGFTLSRSLDPKRVKLRISLLDRRLFSPLLWGLAESLGTEIAIAGIPCQLLESVEILDCQTFKELANTPTQKAISLNFRSPTSFKQKKYIQPFPLVDCVFNSLLRRWNIFAPEELHFPKQEWGGFVTAYDLKTHALKMEGGAEIGSQGWARYRFPDREQARIASILAQFAFFAGVGRKTAMGMGQVQSPPDFAP